MSFNSDLIDACLEVRMSIFGRFRSELSAVKQVITDCEDKIRQSVSGMLGARDYRPFDGDLSPEQRARLLSQIKADIGEMLKKNILMINSGSLKDLLIAETDKLRSVVYRHETEKIAEVVAGLLPEKTKVSVDITKKELDILRKMPLAGLSTRDYIQKILVELYFGVIQAVSMSFTDAKTFEGGIKSSLAEISRKFEAAKNRAARLAEELTVQASNQAMADISAGFKFKRM